MTAFSEAGFAAPVIASSANASIDGYVVQRNGLPYHIHPTATPTAWGILEAAIADSEVSPQDYVAPVPTKANLTAYAETKAQAMIGAMNSYTANETTLESDATSSTRSDWADLKEWASANPSATTQWIANDGSVTALPASAVSAIASAVSAHFRAIYAALAIVLPEIIAGTITTTAEIDAAAWPDHS